MDFVLVPSLVEIVKEIIGGSVNPTYVKQAINEAYYQSIKEIKGNLGGISSSNVHTYVSFSETLSSKKAIFKYAV